MGRRPREAGMAGERPKRRVGRARVPPWVQVARPWLCAITQGVLLAVCWLPVAGLAAPTAPATVAAPPEAAPPAPVMAIISLSHMPCAQAADLVRPLLSARGSVTADERLNRLFVHDVPAVQERIRNLLAQADVAAPQVILQVSFQVQGERAQDPGAWVGVGPTGGVRVVATPGMTRSTSISQALSLTTMSGAEAVITVGEEVPVAAWSRLWSYADAQGLIASGVSWQRVETGFGVIPRVVGTDAVELTVYPRLAWRSDDKAGVVRFMQAATTVRLRPGEVRSIASSSSTSQQVTRHLLGTSTRHGQALQGIEVTAEVLQESVPRP